MFLTLRGGLEVNIYHNYLPKAKNYFTKMQPVHVKVQK
jgi:hypothetical protein